MGDPVRLVSFVGFPPPGYSVGYLGNFMLLVCDRCASMIAPGPGTHLHDAFHAGAGW